jgi:hypothetical protein
MERPAFETFEKKRNKSMLNNCTVYAGSLRFDFAAKFHQALSCFLLRFGFDLLVANLSKVCQIGNGEAQFKNETCQANPAMRSWELGGAKSNFEAQRTSGYSCDTSNCKNYKFNCFKGSKLGNNLEPAEAIA